MGKDKKKRKSHESDSDSDREHRKKSSKKIEKVAKLLGYTNDTNPFGDSNLLQPFVWKKREEKVAVDQGSNESSGGKKSSSKSGDHKRLELITEIEKVRKRREDRENELLEMDRLRDEEQRLREMASYGDWQKKEEEFHTQQIRIRSTIRLIEFRETAVDLLAKNILLVDAATAIDNHVKEDRENNEKLLTLDAELRDPVTIINYLSISDMDKLLGDISAYVELENLRKGPFIKYWDSLLVVAAAARKSLVSSSSSSSNSNVHVSVVQEVEQLLAGKSTAELSRLQSDIDLSIRDGKRGDRDYWERIKKEVTLQQAKAYVVEIHQSLLQEHLGNLKQKHSQLKKESVSVEDEGNADTSTEAAAMVRSERGKGMDDMESAMVDSDEVMLPGSTYWWQDKYRPRKPRFFNRVRLGFDWNKYNSTHYDKENPPPKMIQGYKFTLFYPDLIDKASTPKYFLEPSAGTNDFVILRFHAGPPYEDIAFQIVNREWDFHPRAGFRCLFDRGVLQLHLNFKRRFYRR